MASTWLEKNNNKIYRIYMQKILRLQVSNNSELYKHYKNCQLNKAFSV